MSLVANAHGYDIIHVSGDGWVVDVKEVQKFHGSFKEVTAFCVEKLGFDIDDLLEAFEFLANSENDDAMHFGFYKRFIFTFKYDFSEKKTG